jgi:hypothetical protein
VSSVHHSCARQVVSAFFHLPHPSQTHAHSFLPEYSTTSKFDHIAIEATILSRLLPTTITSHLLPRSRTRLPIFPSWPFSGAFVSPLKQLAFLEEETVSTLPTSLIAILSIPNNYGIHIVGDCCESRQKSRKEAVQVAAVDLTKESSSCVHCVRAHLRTTPSSGFGKHWFNLANIRYSLYITIDLV